MPPALRSPSLEPHLSALTPSADLISRLQSPRRARGRCPSWCFPLPRARLCASDTRTSSLRRGPQPRLGRLPPDVRGASSQRASPYVRQPRGGGARFPGPRQGCSASPGPSCLRMRPGACYKVVVQLENRFPGDTSQFTPHEPSEPSLYSALVVRRGDTPPRADRVLPVRSHEPSLATTSSCACLIVFFLLGKFSR